MRQQQQRWGLALFMFLMGMSTVLGVQLWMFHVYFNFEDEIVEKPLLVEKNKKDQMKKIEFFSQKPISNGVKNMRTKSLIKIADNNNEQILQQDEKITDEPQLKDYVSFGVQEIQNRFSIHPQQQKNQSVDGLREQQNLILNHHSTKLFEDLQSNPVTNLSTAQFNNLRVEQIRKTFDTNKLSERLEQRRGSCQCRIEKDNFKVVIKAKSQKIIKFLGQIEVFYGSMIKNEQLHGRNLSRLGHPAIQIIGQFNELVLFKDSSFDDFVQFNSPKFAIKNSFSFCKWRLIRKVFNEIGICHVENSIFYKQGVLANFGMLQDQVNNKVKQFLQKHQLLCEELELSEKKLLKIKQEYNKEASIVDECVSNYTKASQSIQNYQKQLELEMKFKLSYKKMQDAASQVSDALDSLCETREKFQEETQSMIKELWSLDRNKTEIFKSSLMSIVDTYHEFECQIQLYFDECLKNSQNNQRVSNETIHSRSSIQKQSVILNQSDSIDQAYPNEIEEETIFDRKRKRSMIIKREEVKGILDYNGNDDPATNPPSRQRKDSQQSQNSQFIGPRDLIKEYNRYQLKGDSQNDMKDEDTDKEEDQFHEENFDFYNPDVDSLQLQKLPLSHQFSPQRNIKFNRRGKDFDNQLIESMNENGIYNYDEEFKQEFKFSPIHSPRTSLDGLQPQQYKEINIQQLEKDYSSQYNSANIEIRNIQQGIQRSKDLLHFIKNMNSNIIKYKQQLEQTLDEQYEDATIVLNSDKPMNMLESNGFIRSSLSKIRQLKIKKDSGEIISKTWSNFLTNFKSYIHQYDQVSQKLLEIQQNLEIFIQYSQSKKNSIFEQIRQKQNLIKQLINKAKTNLNQIKIISHQSVGDKQVSSQVKSQYQQYLEQYENIKSKFTFKESNNQITTKNGQLDHKQLEKILSQKFNELNQINMNSQKQLQEHLQVTSQTTNIQKQIQEKLLEVKNELMNAQFERSKNSSQFFRNVMNTIENQFNLESESFEDENLFNEDQSMAIPNEDASKMSNEAIAHRKDCIFFNQIEGNDSLKKSITISPNKKKPYTEELTNYEHNIPCSMNQTSDKISPENSSRGRSMSANEEQKNQTIDFNPQKNVIMQPHMQKQNFSFNFGKQINIFNNYSSQRSNNGDQTQSVNEGIQTNAGIESAAWFNRALNVFYNEWKESPVFQNFILKEAYIIANKGRPKMLSEIEVHKVVLHGRAPEFQRVQKLDSHPDDFLHDIDLSMRGTVEVLIKTEINIDWGQSNFYKIPLTVNIILKSINGKIRVFYSNDKTKGCWYGFVGKPVIKFNLDPVIGKDNRFSIKYIPKLREMIEDLIGKRFDKYCLPNKRPLSIPITKLTNTIWPRVKKQVDKQIGTDFADILSSQLQQKQDQQNRDRKSHSVYTGSSNSHINQYVFDDKSSQNNNFDINGNMPFVDQNTTKYYDEAIKGGLQAVIIAESFQNKFKPVSHERLKCLFPVANVPILHYVIEFLLMNQVTEIYIAVCIHRSQIDKFLKTQNYKGVKINVITLESSSNFGDALREINQLQTIKSDFILARGDIITNVNIQNAIKEHYKVKAEDKEKKLILTKIFVKIPFSNPIRSKQQECAMILDSQTKEILKYESFVHNKQLKINEEYISLKQAQRQFEIRFDLVDSEISICSRDVLNYFTDNFDYESLHDDFINQIQSSEIIEDRIMAQEVTGYYARILDPRTYGEVTQDILSRWIHPLVLDSKLLCPKNNYQFQFLNKYLETDVKIALSTTISNNTQIGKQSKLSEDSKIEKSTIGRKCIIGRNVTIKNSYIWNNVQIHDGCHIENAIVCDNVVLNKNVKVGSGAILSYGVVVNEDQTIPPASMVSKYTYDSKTMTFVEIEESKSSIFADGDISYLPRECQLREDELIGAGKLYNNDEESDFEDQDEEDQEKSSSAFLIEVRKTIERTTPDQIGNAVTEVKSLKMSYNKDLSDCIEAIIPPLLDKINEQNAQKRAQLLQDTLKDWKELLLEFLRAEADEKTFVQHTLVRAIEIYCANNQLFNNSFHIILQIIFKLELLEALIIIKWSQQAQKSIQNRGDEDEIQDEIFDFIDASKREKFIKDMAKFIEYLQKSLEEEEEEEDEEEDEEEEGEEEDEEDQ